MTIKEIHGRTIGPGDTCVMDHAIVTFTVKVRALTLVSEQALKDQIEKKFEVVEITRDDANIFVSKGVDDF